MDGVETFFVESASMDAVMLFRGSSIHARMVMGLSPSLVAVIVS